MLGSWAWQFGEVGRLGGGEGWRRETRDAGRGTRGGWQFWGFGRFMVMMILAS